jgi:6-phosphogluconate dehydrogenase
MGEQKPVSHIGIIGLGTMGTALAQNFADHSIRTSVFNRTYKKTASLIRMHGDDFLVGAKTIQQFISSLKRPRSIMILVPAGDPVDEVISLLLPHLQKGDILIDGGNSHYRDTQKRFHDLKSLGIHFVGCGISGGEGGARTGPSLMPGGSAKAWKHIEPLLSPIAAKDFSGNPCITHVGDNAAGHYVKMIHNGIEYGVMQLIAETYALLRKMYNMSAPDIAEIFASFNSRKLQSYLFEAAIPVLTARDEKKGSCCLIYNILDKASNKGTGKWASVDALNRGIAIPTITQAVYARYISTETQVRKKLSTMYAHKAIQTSAKKQIIIDSLEDALYAALISTFAQGFDLLHKAAKEESWTIEPKEIARIWEGGCIIRAKLLNVLHIQLKKHPKAHLFAIPAIRTLMKKHHPALTSIVKHAAAAHIPVPALSSSLWYFESMIEKRLPANMIQGLRDYFGAHTYERIDEPGSFHTLWS